ncbi:hypothetical protein VIBNISFn118_420039 [Vibrio nigripulchritudo SFn118]|nr:hypothetical protein VIBNISFn118_420039 [Vibrio nigripulchritudo SFn118]
MVSIFCKSTKDVIAMGERAETLVLERINSSVKLSTKKSIV